MYERFYNFKTKPFRLSPDPRFLFQSRGHSRALAYLRYGLQLGEGFIVITGEVGAGKTTVARALIKGLANENVVAAQLLTTQLGSEEMLRMICAAFGLASQDISKSAMLRNLENFMAARAREGKRVVVIVDEAQNLPISSLEELRMLSNYQVGDKAMFQSFLLGQAQFQRTLQSKQLEQFRQRVIAAYHLGPLAAEETEQYIEHRLKLVGWDNDPSINRAAFDAIHKHSGGIPRRINLICDRLFLHGCLEELHQFDGAVVEAVVEEQSAELPQASGEDHEAPAEPGSGAADPAPAPPQGGATMVTDAERRLIALERRVDQLERQLERTRERERTQKLLMMAMYGDEEDLRTALSQSRKADPA